MAKAQSVSPRHAGRTPIRVDGDWRVRAACAADLAAVNRVIESAIDTWQLPERVKLLSKPLYRYTEHDLAFLDLVVAEAKQSGIIAVAAWERADPGDAPAGQTALLLHGIYVDPARHREGVGTRLFEVTQRVAASRGFDGVLVKAQPGAEGFFVARGLTRLPVQDARRDYPHRFWKPTQSP
jgi:GNAT superfamily N-acetyltransferase